VLLRSIIVALALLPTAGAAAQEAPVKASWHLLGRSTQGRPIRALELRGRAAQTAVLVVGCIHGNECAGLAAVRLLERLRRPDLDLWIVPNLNPDGRALGQRQNARGVDLNRNFPSDWRPGARGPEYPGPHPLSEPESRLARALIVRIRPQLTVWYHQPQDLVRAWGPSIPAARVYARASGLRFAKIRWPNGTGPNWQNHRFPGCASFVVELPPGPLGAAAAQAQVRGVLASSRAARC
jgi:protein MpaA